MDNLELAKECGADTVEVIDGNFESPEDPYFTYCFERHQLDEFASRVTADKDAEIERLNALVAMQSEALTCVYEQTVFDEDRILFNIIDSAVSATAETVSAWQNEVKAAVFDRAISICNSYGDRDIANCKAAYELAEVFETEASELRAKGE